MFKRLKRSAVKELNRGTIYALQTRTIPTVCSLMHDQDLLADKRARKPCDVSFVEDAEERNWKRE